MTLVRTARGSLEGTDENGVCVFRAVPYAAPPVADLRFRPTQPVASWHGTRDATRHGPIAPQGPSRLRLAMGDFSRPQDEDCLTLTIWTPAPDATRRPVLVWLHGGAWISGAGSLDWYSGARLSREGDLVVVGVNHRLGALGYLHHPSISEGNLGTLDQIAALEWVAAHIGDFGGDPTQVTLVGQSAGAGTIGRLLASRTAPGLFHRVVLQSGGFGRPAGSPERATTRAEQLLHQLGIDPDAGNAAALLRDTAAAQIVAAQGAVARANAVFGDTTPPFGPVAAATSQNDPTAAIADAASELGVLIGATGDEGHAFFPPGSVSDDRDAIAARFAAVTGDPGALARCQARRPGATTRDLLADLTTQDVFVGPTMRLAEAIAARGGSVFAYQFDWAPPASPFKACHCIDLPFTFGNLAAWDGAPMLAGGDPATMQALSTRMRRAWIGFARDGSPEHDDMPPWPTYGGGQRRVMRIAEVLGAVGDPAGFDIS